MQLVKLGAKGQVTIPRAILRQLDMTGDTPLLAETTEDGAILLRPAAVYPIEIYSDERVAEFERENTAPSATLAKVRKRLDKR
ncbi:MAG: AbrB/MazE/SpoVT family DNA-binding domain-containing protein [Sinobacteraceae bacterium]|nr:AbrB/MazE/SpoVT family DNA-binding domain-containing protein [Nevskiaceae bacterium]